MARRIGVLTGGGDCPGINAVIRAIVKKGIESYGYEIIGVRDGWRGLLDLEVEPLTLDKVSGILYRGGTILGTSRTNPGKIENGYDTIKDNFVKLGLEGLIAIGGEDTLGVAYKLYEMGIPLVGIPKTIDNDLSATDLTFGFDTAVNIVMEAIDRLHTTAESHHRVMVVEVMGRHTGWIAVYGGLAGGADAILIPEEPFEIDELCRIIQRRYEKGKRFSIIVVAEGAYPKGVGKYFTRGGVDEFGHYRLGGVGEALAQDIEKRTGFETRAISLGHIQRGGCPTAYDRILATRLGVAAVDLVAEGRFGEMPALKGNRIVPVSLKEAIGKLKTVDKEIYEVAKIFFS
ncbi:MAG: ATP-dependent 6-phosphofructokinase [Candidatus Bathyarchaeia archaeon]